MATAKPNIAVEKIRTIAQRAYIYGYAPVYMERQRRNMVSVDIDMGDGRAPENTFSWLRRLATPALKVIVMPNNDTLYGSAWLDLGVEPYVLEVPDMRNRYFCLQLMDPFSNTYGYVGSRATGDKGGRFALVGPNWKEKLPADLDGTIMAPATTIWIAARMAIAGPEELETVHNLQDAVRLTPLSGKSVAIHNPKYAPLPPPERLPAVTFFEILGDVLKAYPTPAPAQALVEEFAVIGLSPDSGFDRTGLSPEAKAALGQGAEDAFAAIEQAKLGQSVNGWDFSMKNGRFGEDYLLRSAIAYRSLAGNVPEEAIYFNCNKDTDGHPLDGAQRYELRFENGQLPPVSAFWSLTMYDGKDFFLVENPINRYAVSDRTKGLKYGADGSLTLYIQHESPGQDRESNWLPAPAGVFDVHLRTYVPKPALLKEEYRLPPLKRIAADKA